MKILLIEDNKIIAKGLIYSLTANGYEVEHCLTCGETIAKSGEDYSLMIIDVSLPDGNGFDLYQEIKRYNSTPAIFLTALDDEDNIVKGLELGAEDYITKPFSTRELLARIRRITNRNISKNVIVIGDITADLESMTVKKNDSIIELTALEYRIFSMLIQNLGKTVTREIILEKIWDISGSFVNDNTLTVYIKRIRQKLDTDLIKTVKGIGYRMEKQ